ncbi:MAG TPA: thioredoxin domain-containing protein [Verrucomicrobiae bacterium]|nr:thioredoxin domain-containing protein [Verrucomicrobiae bacterium]
MKFVALALAALATGFAAGPDVDKGKAMGNPSAPITLELYSDFMCPHCKHLHEDILPAIIADFVKTGKAYLVFREFPLNIPQHVYSRPAANYAVAAARIGKYQQACDALFKAQQQWGMTGKVWETVATALTPEEQKKVQALASDPSVLAEVQKDYDLGTRSQINQTPTVIVTYKLKQQPWSFWDDYNLFKGYLDGLLKK